MINDTTNGRNHQPAGQIEGHNAGQIETNVPGAGRERDEEQDNKPVARSAERAIHNKAFRTIAGRHDLGPWTLEYIATLSTYLRVRHLENIGTAEDIFIDWSGARTNWKRKMKGARQEAEIKGLIDIFKSGVGHAIDLSHKGRMILHEYDERYEEIEKDLEEREILEALKMEGKRLRRIATRRKNEARASQAAG